MSVEDRGKRLAGAVGKLAVLPGSCREGGLTAHVVAVLFLEVLRDFGERVGVDDC